MYDKPVVIIVLQRLSCKDWPVTFQLDHELISAITPDRPLVANLIEEFLTTGKQQVEDESKQCHSTGDLEDQRPGTG